MPPYGRGEAGRARPRHRRYAPILCISLDVPRRGPAYDGGMPLQKKRTTASTQHSTIRRLVGVAGSLALAATFSFGRGGEVAGADTASGCTLAPAFAALRERV